MVIFKLDAEFYELVDELLKKAETDEELARGIAWIKAQSERHGVSFYQEFFRIMYMKGVEDRAKRWVKTLQT